MAMQDSQFYSNNTPDYMAKSYAGSLIRYQQAGMAPMFALTSLMGDGKALAVEHGYMSKTLVFPSVELSDAVDGAEVVFPVVSVANVLPGDMFRASTTGEIVRVMSIAGLNMTVRRQTGQIAAAPLTSGTVLHSVGNAHEQGSLRPPSRLMNPVRILNYTQIFRNTWMLPGTVAALTTTVGGTITHESREDASFFHSSDIEKALIFGQRSGQIVNNQYLTTMDGLVETVRRYAPTSNTITALATTNYTQLSAMVEAALNTVVSGQSTNERIIFAGGDAVRVINEIGRLSGQYQIIDGQTTFGLSFTSFRTARGKFKLFEHAVLNTNPVWSKMALVVNIPSLKICYLRKTRNDEFGMNGTPVDQGIDAVGGTLTTELTLENTNPSAHVVIYGLTAGTGD